MSKTNRYAIHTQFSDAARTHLKELKQDYLRIQADNAARKRIIEEARARDQEWAEYVTTINPLRGKQRRLL